MDAAASLYEEVAAELEQAAAHARVSAEHFRNREIPRAAAHAWAVRGHALAAGRLLDEQAVDHARRSRPVV